MQAAVISSVEAGEIKAMVLATFSRRRSSPIPSR